MLAFDHLELNTVAALPAKGGDSVTSRGNSWALAAEQLTKLLHEVEKDAYDTHKCGIEVVTVSSENHDGHGLKSFKQITATLALSKEKCGIHGPREFRAEVLLDPLLARPVVSQYLQNKIQRFEQLAEVRAECSFVAPCESGGSIHPGVIIVSLDYSSKSKACRSSRDLRYSTTTSQYSFKFLSFNIWVGGGLSLPCCIDVIRASDADVICLQEATPLTVELIAHHLGASDYSTEHSLISLLGVDIERINEQTVLLRPTEGDENMRHTELFISNIHLTAYPYAPHIAAKDSLEAAIQSEKAVQGEEIKHILKYNNYSTNTSDAKQMHQVTSVPLFDDQSDSTSEQDMSPDVLSPLGNETPMASLGTTPLATPVRKYPGDASMYFGTAPTASHPIRRMEVLCGDFNAPSHLDLLHIGGKGEPVKVNWVASHECQKAGFTDAFRHCNEQPDECAAHVPFYSWSPMVGRERNNCFDRIDFVYARRTSRDGLFVPADEVVLESKHLDSTPTGRPWPSDHRAVFAVFKVL